MSSLPESTGRETKLECRLALSDRIAWPPQNGIKGQISPHDSPIEVHINEDQIIFGNWLQIQRKIPFQGLSFPMPVLALPCLPLKHSPHSDSHP
jgi:hypothetical protein